MSFKKCLGVFTLSLFLLFSPIQTRASTDDSEYRAVLLNLIAVLQEQISLLQAELYEQSAVKTVEPDENSLFQSLVDIVARYQISEPEDVEKIEDEEQRKHFMQFFDLLPSEYDDKFSQLIVFTGDAVEFDAFVETTSGEYQEWTYAIRSDIVKDPDFYADTELMVHELGHVVSYESLSDISSDKKTCSFYFDEDYCYPLNSYLGQFVKEFWLDINLRDAEDFHEYYEENTKEFVTEYAATNPDEDFAESFSYFVLGAPVDGGEAEDKIDFFSDYPKLLFLKDYIKDETR